MPFIDVPSDSFFAPLRDPHSWLFVAAVLLVLFILLRTRSRRFYFVRHGETILNAKRIRQSDAGGLTEKGRRQADAAGAYLKQFHVKKIISSPFERTKETTALINQHLHVPIAYSNLLAERRNPSEIIGKSMDDPEVQRITGVMDGSYHDDNYRFSDEENFADLRRRARQALGYLSRQGTQDMCIVTHSIFLKMLIAYLLYRNRLHASDYVKFSFFNTAGNAGITICDYHPWRMFNATRGWEVVAYDETPPPPQETMQPRTSLTEKTASLTS